MDVTREHISHILELREILLSFQTGFSLVNAAVVCAIVESISGLEPSSVITEPRYLKLVFSNMLECGRRYCSFFRVFIVETREQTALDYTACFQSGNMIE